MTTGYAYEGDKTTITDANQNAKYLTYDANGWLRSTEDATGYTVTLSYDAAGSHTGTSDSLGTTLWSGSVAYGMSPFTVAATDADLGAWTYTFDALGELTAWKDAKGQTFSAKYDNLSRMTDRYEPDLYTHWTWGANAAAYEIGRLRSVCTGTGTSPTACSSAGYAESETYDSAGRPYKRAITIPGDTTYTYTQTYNADGLPDIVEYPTGPNGYVLSAQYGYSHGLLTSIQDVSGLSPFTLWTADSVNARGQFTTETLGNKVVINHAFDGVTGLLSSITAGLGGGTALQNESYLFDPVGNLTQRQDINAGTTESIYYDSLNRLSYTVGDTNTHLTYDSMGRVATWEAYANSTNVNDYTTTQAGCTYYANAQPHAVRESTQGAYPPTSSCYDANGNLTTESSSGSVDRFTSWMSFNQPNVISAPSYNSSSQFFYDQNHQRYEQVASYSGSPETTEYIGGLMEKMTNSTGTAYRYYVPAGNNFIIYNRWTNGTNAIDYASRDNIGSTAVITDNNGALVVSEKYAALGWGENNAAGTSITRHEFTGQEGLNNSGLWLVNMNGRIYNSSGARFFSPDPIIQDPTNTQNYNRYSYVFNNPMTYVDPSGFGTTCEDFTVVWQITGSYGGVQFSNGFSDGGSYSVCHEGPDAPDLGDTSAEGGGGGGGGDWRISAGRQTRAEPSLAEVLVKGSRIPRALPPAPVIQFQNVVALDALLRGTISIPDFVVQSRPQCDAARARLGRMGQQLASLGKFITWSGVGLGTVSGVGAFLAPEGAPVEIAGMTEAAGLVELGGYTSTLGDMLQGYAKGGISGELQQGLIDVAIDQVTNRLVGGLFGGVAESNRAVAAGVLAELPGALQAEQQACGAE